ncbi:amidohydrolase 3 [Colletotrichum kahawae]|uniref:Amidohydrolase 3 n=1 Tax=Colletotrichum kahawae TaxID=34407 RepID=A0AAD9YF35_COLKA|nr:amidohydrolase 3 [Colletotrichum kahawae]
MASDGGYVDIAEPCQSYKASTNYFLQWLWAEYKIRAPEAAKTHTFKSINDILRAAKTLAATAATVPATVIDSLRNAIKKRQEVLQIYQGMGSDDAAHEAFLRRLQETLEVLTPLLSVPLTTSASTSDSDLLLTTNRFSALCMHESTESFLSDAPFMSRAQEQPQKVLPDNTNLVTPGKKKPGIILEDDLITLAIEGVTFMLRLQKLRQRVENYWTAAAEWEMPFALASWLTSLAMSIVQIIAPQDLAFSIGFLMKRPDMALAFFSKAIISDPNIQPLTLMRETSQLFGLMLVIKKHAGPHPKNCKCHSTTTGSEAVTATTTTATAADQNTAVDKEEVIGYKRANSWSVQEISDFVVPEILGNIKQDLGGKRGIEMLERGYTPALPPKYLDLAQKLLSGQVSRREFHTRPLAAGPDHDMTLENLEQLKAAIRTTTCEPLYVPALETFEKHAAASIYTLSSGMGLLISSCKAYFWPRGVRQREWNCRLRPLRLAKNMKAELLPIIKVAKNLVANGKALMCYVQTAEDLLRSLEEYIEEERWDLYHRAPWTAGCHVNEMLCQAMFISHMLFSAFDIIPVALHLYNVLRRSVVKLDKIPVFEELCEFFRESVFYGMLPTVKFLTSFHCSLYYNWRDTMSGKCSPHRRPYYRESVYVNQHHSNHILNYEIMAKLHGIEGEEPFNESQRARLRSLRDNMTIDSYMEKAEIMARKEFEGPQPVANIDYFAIFNLCSEVLDCFGKLVFPFLIPDDRRYFAQAKDCNISVGKQTVDSILLAIDEEARKGSSARHVLIKIPAVTIAVMAFDTVDRNKTIVDLVWKV